ncbi:MAG: cyanophycin synthetase [bacterium]
MKVERVTYLAGRNIYSHSPVLRLTLDLGKWAGKTTAEIPHLEEKLFALLPGLGSHHCSLAYPGGFRTRVREGTYLGHVLEHMILELQTVAGSRVFYGRTRESRRPGVYEIVVECPCEEGGREAVNLAVELLQGLVGEGVLPDLAVGLARLRQIMERNRLGPSTAAIAEAARKRGIPVQRLDDRSLLQLGYGKYQQRVQATITAGTGCIGVDIACDKALTKELLARAGIPVPPGVLVHTEEEALRAAGELGYPLVIKPYNGNQGKGVSLHLTTTEEIREACSLARQYSPRLLVEKQIPGRHYRLLVVGDRVVAAAERLPASVVGDGTNNLSQLIEITNRDPRRGEGHEKPLTKIVVDPVVLACLRRRGIGLDYVPPPGERVFLRDNANLSTGGTAVDVTDQLHPANALVALRAARAVGLDVAGVDLVTADISSPLQEAGGAVIEVNAAPGLRMHLYPTEGQGRDVAGEIVDYLFPPGRPSRIPVVAITGTNGKTTTARLVAHVLRSRGLKVGLATTDGIWLDDHCLLRGDTTGPWSARLLLGDPLVEAAVLETARGGILRGGLGYDLSDVGVITNISRDHLGQDGLEDLEDLAFVKSLVLEAVHPEGCAVLNADDPLVASLAPRARCRLIYFSLKEDNVLLRRHLSEGGEGVFLQGGQVVAARGAEGMVVVPLAKLPVAWNGQAEHNVANVLAATAACLGLGLSPQEIGRALATFTSHLDCNPGRCNLIERGDFRVLVDYGHNPAAYRAVLETARKLKPRRLLGVIGVPGDRADDLVRESGRIAGEGFDYIFIKEDRDLRGRAPGEIAGLLREGALAGGCREEKIEIVLDEGEAIRRALARAQRGDLLVIFYEQLEPVLEILGLPGFPPPSPARAVESRQAAGWGGD